MTFNEFKETKEVKAIIKEILKHDTDNNIVAIGLPEYHLTSENNITSGDGGINLFIFTKVSDIDSDLFDFILAYNDENRNKENTFSLYSEILTPADNTPCLSIYSA